MLTAPAGVHSPPPKAAVSAGAQLLPPVLELQTHRVRFLGAVGGDSLPLQLLSKLSSTAVLPTELPSEEKLTKPFRGKQGMKHLFAVTGTSQERDWHSSVLQLT